MTDRERINELRERYPKGTRIVVDFMDDARPVAPGTKGSVDFVDDIGTIHCTFDNGRMLGVIPDADRFHEVTSKDLTDAEIISSIDCSRDVFFMNSDKRFCTEIYYNPDAAECPGFVVNTIVFSDIILAEKEARGNVSKFFYLLEDWSPQTFVRADGSERFRAVYDEFMARTEYSGLSAETMKGMCAEAREALDRNKVKKTEHER